MKRILIIAISICVYAFNANAQTYVIPELAVDTPFHCVGNTVQFYDQSQIFIANPLVPDSIHTWLWDFGDGNSSSLKNPSHTYLTAGKYFVKLTVSNNTETKTTLDYTITVRNLPVVDFTFSDSSKFPFYFIFFRGQVTNADSDPYTYSWNFPNQVIYSDTTSQLQYMFPSAGSFPVSFIVEAGKNCLDTVTYNILTADSMVVPNVFSPNGDGENDVFIFKTNGATIYEFTVYNRWGAIMYTITAKRIYWDGRTSSGEILPRGNYFYKLVSVTEPAYEKTGFIYLAR